MRLGRGVSVTAALWPPSLRSSQQLGPRRRSATPHSAVANASAATKETRTIADHRINAEIKVPEVRLVDAEGGQVGIVSLADALRQARASDMDLVEVAPNADPPVCRIMDYGRFKYQEAQKQKEARKRQSQITIKEIKMRPKISDNDYKTKSGHVRRFLNDGAKVKATIMFRGREMAHTELGKRLLDRLAEDMEELATIEAYPKVDGRNMVMVLAPVREKKPRTKAEAPADAEAETPTDADTVAVVETETEANADA